MALQEPAGLGAPPAAYEQLLAAIPEFATFGMLYKSSAPVELTEPETEYVVNVVKHIFERHVVLQYNCKNTIPGQVLENVHAIVDVDSIYPRWYDRNALHRKLYGRGLVDENFVEVARIPIDTLGFNIPGHTFVAFRKSEGIRLRKFLSVLMFSADGGLEDEYKLDDFELDCNDFLLKAGCVECERVWETLGSYCTYELGPLAYFGMPKKSLQEAVDQVVSLFQESLQPCEGTEVVLLSSASHNMFLSCYSANRVVLVKFSFNFIGPEKVGMNWKVRSSDETAAAFISDSLSLRQLGFRFASDMHPAEF